MNRRKLIKSLAAAIPAMYLSNKLKANGLSWPGSPTMPFEKGPFEPNWDSLKQYAVPDWFRDAKFGIWAHWAPQCQPEHGDWYARSMYQEGSEKYNFHLKKYGHPSKFGFKDVIND